jgi:hypothetical protein
MAKHAVNTDGVGVDHIGIGPMAVVEIDRLRPLVMLKWFGLALLLAVGGLASAAMSVPQTGPSGGDGLNGSRQCPKGTIGKWPNCRRITVTQPRACPKGTVGQWPKCTKRANVPEGPRENGPTVALSCNSANVREVPAASGPIAVVSSNHGRRDALRVPGADGRTVSKM